MLILLLAWLFWLALNGRLALYAGFATTAGSGGTVGSLLANFSIPVALSGTLNVPGLTGPGGVKSAGPNVSSSPASTNPTVGGANPLGNLPASDTSPYGVLSGYLTGYLPSGLPTTSTLGTLSDQAAGNVAGGAAGL